MTDNIQELLDMVHRMIEDDSKLQSVKERLKGFLEDER